MVGVEKRISSASLVVEKGHGEALYHLLKEKKWLNPKMQPKETANGFLAIPINEKCPITEVEINAFLNRDAIGIRFENVILHSSPPSVKPHSRLQESITRWLEKNLEIGERESKAEVMAELMAEVPTKWERLGDLILLPQTAFSHDSLFRKANSLLLYILLL